MLNILTLSPHLGGGVGSVLDNLLSNIKANHTVICLDKNYQLFKKSKISIQQEYINKIPELLTFIKKADIVLLNAWNHPLLFKLLLENRLPACRLLTWYHNLGMFAPYLITKELVNISDFFVLTTPASLKVNVLKNSSYNTKIKTIFSTRGIDDFLTLQPKKHFGFNVGYIGTLDYSKLHPHFISFCNQINSSNLKFLLCGNCSSELLEDIKKSSQRHRFKCVGHVSDIKQYLSIMDVFGYPLSPFHYGSSEQVLAESMASGVVPIVLNNLPESYIIKHNDNGFIVSEEDYSKSVKFLLNDFSTRKKLSQGARETAKEIYSTEKMVKAWTETIESALSFPKQEKQFFKKNQSFSGFEVFAHSLGEFKDIILTYAETSENKQQLVELLLTTNQWDSETKASPRHYLKYFPEDKKLQKIVKILDTLKERRQECK